MNKIFLNDWEELSAVQKESAMWNEGAIVILAGPGSGKTRVLTCHIAYLLDISPEQSFRILGLTFTNKAADEMRTRVQKYVPNQERRLFLGTFHSFCADVLRQHGAHLGINSNFRIYTQESDLQSVLDDAVANAQKVHNHISGDLRKALPVINKLKSNLIFPNEAKASISDPILGEKLAIVYEAYEQELTKKNALDFNSLILRTCELFNKIPALADRYRKVYKYICIDEFQDTNLAQYNLIKSITGSEYKNVFVVADDDQIIYQWNGASHKCIQNFVEQYESKLLQLPVNYRCPPEVVNIANKLINHNFNRTPNKADIESSRISNGNNVVRVLSGFDKATLEGVAIADDIKNLHSDHLNKVVVLARNRKLLETVESSLNAVQVSCIIHQRRDNFQSTPFQLLISILSLADDRQDKKNVVILCGTFGQISGISINPELIEAQANLLNRDFLQQWHKVASQQSQTEWSQSVINLVQEHLISTSVYMKFADLFIDSIDHFIDKRGRNPENEIFYRYDEEKEIWKKLVGEIKSAIGSNPVLGAFLHELQMRPKDPVIPDDTVSLMTIHSAKGKEFKHVYLVGLVEGELPSFQSIQKGPASIEIEEERRNCFVAITRTEETLTLSYADNYRGWAKKPSRFLSEMGLLEKRSP